MTTAKTPKRGQYARSETTRARILDAAMVLASKVGYQHVSISAIAAEAGVALGMMNYHFGSKQQLLLELMASQVDAFVSRLPPRAEGEGFFTYELSLLGTYLDFLHVTPAYVRLTEEVRHHAPDLYRQGVDANVAEIEKRLRIGIERQELRPMPDSEVLANAYLIQGAYSFLDRFLEDPRFPGNQVLLNAVQRLLKQGLGEQV
jgi:AcrR family transcriptional regulator